LNALPDFIADYKAQFTWYLGEAGEGMALKFERAVEMTFFRLSREPSLGRARKFRHPKLSGLRSLAILKPFDRILIFYRLEDDRVVIWRLMHGARNLSRRLLESNE
jgi:plasmid stabilization system protein ParE